MNLEFWIEFQWQTDSTGCKYSGTFSEFQFIFYQLQFVMYLFNFLYKIVKI